MSIPDYSQVENFNMAAIDAVRENFKVDDIVDNVVSVVYNYKGRTLKVTAEVSLDGEQVRYVGVQNVEVVKGDYMFVWSVREEIPYEGNNWECLVRDDENTLDKVKDIVIKQLRESIKDLKECIKHIQNGSEKTYLSIRPDNKTRMFQLEKGINDLNLSIVYVECLTALDDWKTVNNRGYDIEVSKVEVL